MNEYIKEIEQIAAKCTESQSDGYSQIMRICDAMREQQKSCLGYISKEELKKIAEKYNWKLEVWHGEYKGILCGVQKTNPGEEPLPLYRFPGGVSLA